MGEGGGMSLGGRLFLLLLDGGDVAVRKPGL